MRAMSSFLSAVLCAMFLDESQPICAGEMSRVVVSPDKIKDVLLLGWLDYFVNQTKERDKVALSSQIDKLKKLGARLTLDDHNRVIGVHLGERMVTDADMVHLRGLQHLQELDLTRTKITSAGLTNIKDLTALTKLFLTDTKVDDSGIAHLKGMKNLRFAGLSGTSISDAALDHLRALTELKQLFCLGTNVTHAGVEKLQRALPQCEVTH